MAGVGVETLNLEVATLDEVSDTIARSAGFVIGSPTLGGHMPTQVPFPLGCESIGSSRCDCSSASALLAMCRTQILYHVVDAQ